MANEQNLIPMSERSKAEHLQLSAKGGRASGESKRKAKSMREAARILLEAPLLDDERTAELLAQLGLVADQQSAILLSAITKAKNGDIEAGRYVRDTSGQAPSQQLELGGIDGQPIETMDLSTLTTDQLHALLSKQNEDSHAGSN